MIITFTIHDSRFRMESRITNSMKILKNSTCRDVSFWAGSVDTSLWQAACNLLDVQLNSTKLT